MEQGALRAVAGRAQAGEAEAFAELYGHFFGRVFGLCRHLLGSAEAAEDATSEVFLRARRALRSYNGTRPFAGWLLSIASHYCLDQLRRRWVEQRVFGPQVEEWNEPEAAGPSPLRRLLDAEQAGALRGALEALPERARLTLVLRYEGEFSYDQIAAALGLNRNHVATLIFRAKKHLRRTLAPVLEDRKR